MTSPQIFEDIAALQRHEREVVRTYAANKAAELRELAEWHELRASRSVDAYGRLENAYIAEGLRIAVGRLVSVEVVA